MSSAAYGPPDLPVTIEEARTLPIPEIAIRLLRFAQEPLGQWAGNRHDLGLLSTWTTHRGLSAEEGQEMTFVMVEAWDWLQHRGLVAISPGTDKPGKQPSWYVTNRGAEVSADERVLSRLQAEERLGVDLHPLIAVRIRSQYALGEYEAAAFLALREVEIRVRALADLPELLGVNLMKQAFKKDGPLTDPAQDGGEQEATMALFWGAIGVFKNPSSHREVNYDDPTVAAEAVLLADLLLRLLDAMAAKVADRKVEKAAREGRERRKTSLDARQ